MSADPDQPPRSSSVTALEDGPPSADGRYPRNRGFTVHVLDITPTDGQRRDRRARGQVKG